MARVMIVGGLVIAVFGTAFCWGTEGEFNAYNVETEAELEAVAAKQQAQKQGYIRVAVTGLVASGVGALILYLPAIKRSEVEA